MLGDQRRVRKIMKSQECGLLLCVPTHWCIQFPLKRYCFGGYIVPIVTTIDTGVQVWVSSGVIFEVLSVQMMHRCEMFSFSLTLCTHQQTSCTGVV